MGRFRIKGSVSPGMFPHERILVLNDDQGQMHTLIVPEDQVEEDGTILVFVLDEKGEAVLVRLPGELIDTGRTMSVARGALIPA